MDSEGSFASADFRRSGKTDSAGVSLWSFNYRRTDVFRKNIKTAMVKTKVARRISDIPAEEWNSVFPDTVEGYHFFETLDQSGLEQFSFYYIMAYRGNAPAGAAPCFIMEYPLDTTVRGPLRGIAGSIKKFLPKIFNLKALICGLPTGEGQIGVSGCAEEVMSALCGRMEAIASEEGASVIAFKDFNLSYAKMLEPLLRKGFAKIDSFPSTVIDVNFTSFDSYIGTLSPSSREGVRRKFKKADKLARIDCEVVPELKDETLEDAYRLYIETVNHHEAGFEILPKDFFRNVSKNMPGQARYFLWRIGGKLAAFTLCLASKDYFMDYNLGFDYSVAHQYHLYFIRFRDMMKWCIENGIKKYEMGPTSYEAKKRLGFGLIPLYIYARHRSRIINPFFRILSPLLKPENFDPVIKQMKRKER